MPALQTLDMLSPDADDLRRIAGTSRPYLGQVSSRGMTFDAIWSSPAYKQVMSRTNHFMGEALSAPASVFLGYAGKDETSSSAAINVTMSIEYPIGTFNRVTFSGSNTGTIPSGGKLISDAWPVTPLPGAFYREWVWASSTGNLPYMASTSYVDRTTWSATTTTDLTAAGGSLGTSDQTFHSAATIALTRRPAVFVVGDSREASIYQMGGVNDPGRICRSIGASVPYICAAASQEAFGSDRGSGWAVGNPTLKRRADLAIYCSHIVCALGVNAATGGGDTAAGIVSQFTATAALFPNKRFFICTIEPYTGGANALADGSDQTYNPTNNVSTVVDATNVLIRDRLPDGCHGLFDIAKVAAMPTDSKKWVYNYTTDRLHGNARYNNAVAASGLVNPAVFGQYGSLPPL